MIILMKPKLHPLHINASSAALAPYRSSLPDQLPFTYFTYFFLLLILWASCNHGNTVSGLNTSTSAAITGCPFASFTPNMAATKEEADLKVLVPNITSLRQFVNCSDPANVRGFCIDVFEMALSILTPPPATLPPNFSIHYTCFNFSSSPGSAGPTYDDMVDLVANRTFDVVVGDVTIGAHRLSLVDFTHKYMESGVVLVTNVGTEQVSPWLFFGWPFSLRLWCTIVGAFSFTSLLVCYLEKDNHPEFTQGRLTQRSSNILWFSIEALVLLERESLTSAIARGVMLAWLFFVVLLNASYTAGLSSFLTANNLAPSTQDILSLRDSGQKIGYRRGSIVKDYLTRRFHLREEVLIPLRLVSEFVNNITSGPKHGGVVAIVDELPYANIMLSTLSSSTCDFGIAGPQLTQEGFGFGFNKESNLEHIFSIALMNLTESGCLQGLQVVDGMSTSSKCSTTNAPSNKVTWRSSFSLFVPLLGLLSLCVLVHYLKKYVRPRQSHPDGDAHVFDDSTIRIHSTIIHRHQHAEVELQQYPF